MSDFLRCFIQKQLSLSLPVFTEPFCFSSPVYCYVSLLNFISAFSSSDCLSSFVVTSLNLNAFLNLATLIPVPRFAAHGILKRTGIHVYTPAFPYKNKATSVEICTFVRCVRGAI